MIDYIFMTGSQQLRNVNIHLCQAMHGSISKMDFRNISISAVGDLYQLSPAAQNPAFECPNFMQGSGMAPLPRHYIYCV